MLVAPVVRHGTLGGSRPQVALAVSVFKLAAGHRPLVTPVVSTLNTKFRVTATHSPPVPSGHFARKTEFRERTLFLFPKAFRKVKGLVGTEFTPAFSTC